MDNINLYIVIPFIILVVVLIAYLIRRNFKDKKKVTENFIQSDLKQDKHQNH